MDPKGGGLDSSACPIMPLQELLVKNCAEKEQGTSTDPPD